MFGFRYDENTEQDQGLLNSSLEIYLIFQDLDKIAKAADPK